jgi:triphosphoribosyl-dephospho-CoA synthetase
LIARKVGLKKTSTIKQAVKIGMKEISWISESAHQILKIGGLTTTEGKKALMAFDRRLRVGKGDLNPGTSADLTAGSLMICFLCGFRF